jgi:hypothetical protein
VLETLPIGRKVENFLHYLLVGVDGVEVCPFNRLEPGKEALASGLMGFIDLMPIQGVLDTEIHVTTEVCPPPNRSWFSVRTDGTRIVILIQCPNLPVINNTVVVFLLITIQITLFILVTGARTYLIM